MSVTEDVWARTRMSLSAPSYEFAATVMLLKLSAGAMPASAQNPAVVAVQTTEPYDVMPFRMTDGALCAGRALWQSLIRRFAECEAADFWPGVAPTVLDFDVMPWASMGDGERYQEDQF